MEKVRFKAHIMKDLNGYHGITQGELVMLFFPGQQSQNSSSSFRVDSSDGPGSNYFTVSEDNQTLEIDFAVGQYDS